MVAVLTLPAPHRRLARDRATLQSMKRSAVDCARAWAVAWAWHGADVEVAGFCVIHPEGDVGGWAPHFNIILPSIALDRKDGRNRRGRWHLPKSALDDLRARWERALEKFSPLPFCHVQVFYEHRHTIAQKMHSVHYFCRHFPAWQGWAQAVSWFGYLRLRAELEPEEYRPPFRCQCGGTFVTVSSPAISAGPRAPP